MGIGLLVMVAAFGQVPFQSYVLNSEVNVWDVAAKDVTGDGQAEVFVLCCDEKSRPLQKYVGVYVADGSGGYTEAPTVKIELEARVSTLFFAEVDGKAPVELVAADAEGATVFRYADGHFVPVETPRFNSLFPYGSKEPLFMKETARDLDGDGIDEWLIPVPSGYEVRKPSATLCTIPCDVVSEMSDHDSMYIFHRLPAVHAFPIEGESSKALAFLSDEEALFAHGPGWSEHARYVIPVALDDKWEAATRMDDIDGNKLPDLVVTQTKGTINLKVVTQVYMASSKFTYPDKPTALFEADGAIASPALIDVDGDGTKDLVFINIPFGVTNIVNYFVRGKLSIRVDVYLFKDGSFPAKPTYTEKLTLDAPEGRERVAYAFGDFSGDKRLDVLFGAGSDKLVIHTSSPDRMLSAKPYVTLSMPAFGIARAVDLNGNEAKDLLLHHPGGSNKKRVDVVVF